MFFRFKVNKNLIQLIGGFVLQECVIITFCSPEELKILPLTSLFQSLVHSLKVLVSLHQRLGWIRIYSAF